MLTMPIQKRIIKMLESKDICKSNDGKYSEISMMMKYVCGMMHVCGMISILHAFNIMIGYCISFAKSMENVAYHANEVYAKQLKSINYCIAMNKCISYVK